MFDSAPEVRMNLGCFRVKRRVREYLREWFRELHEYVHRVEVGSCFRGVGVPGRCQVATISWTRRALYRLTGPSAMSSSSTGQFSSGSEPSGRHSLMNTGGLTISLWLRLTMSAK